MKIFKKIKYLILFIIISKCFADLKVGIDFSSQYESSNIDASLENGLTLSYEYYFDDKWGINFEYLFPTKISNHAIEIGLLNFNILQQVYSKDSIQMFAKYGYSMPDFEWDSNSSYISKVYGGLLYGFQINFFNEIQIAYTLNNSTIKLFDLLDDEINKKAVKCNRLTIFYIL